MNSLKVCKNTSHSTMSSDRVYKNFVRASSPDETPPAPVNVHFIRGEDAKRMYLEEVKDVKVNDNYSAPAVRSPEIHKKHKSVPKRKSQNNSAVLDNDLFTAVQNNDTHILDQALETNPSRLNILDDYGWSLLMIACQANSVEVVKELLKRGADTSVRDKAGNSARSLVIRNKNIELATLLLDHSKASVEKSKEYKKQKHKEEFDCESCGKSYPDKQEHLSSTVHNINASKGKTITSSFKIPESNKGFQIMLKRGWDKNSGLGASGEGRRYPIRPVEKKDRKGLGLKKKQETYEKEAALLNKKINVNHKSEYNKNRNMEINFRREFY